MWKAVWSKSMDQFSGKKKALPELAWIKMIQREMQLSNS